MRLTVRRTMVLTAVVAAALWAWVKWDRDRWGSYRTYLDDEMRWCQSPTAWFIPAVRPGRPSTTCLLKISDLDIPVAGGTTILTGGRSAKGASFATIALYDWSP